MIKNYMKLCIYFLLWVIVTNSAQLPIKFEPGNWNNIQSIKAGGALIIPPEFINLRKAVEPLKKTNGCTLYLSASEVKNNQIDELKNTITSLNTKLWNAQNNVAVYDSEIKAYEEEINKLPKKVEDLSNTKGQDLIEAIGNNKKISELEEKIQQSKTTKKLWEKDLNLQADIKKIQTEYENLKNEVDNTFDLLLNKDTLTELSGKQTLFNFIEEVNTNDDKEKELSVYIHAVMASFISENTAMDDSFLNLRDLYQKYILTLGNVFNWFISKNDQYNKVLQKLISVLMEQDDDNEYKISFIALLHDCIKYYHSYIEVQNKGSVLLAKEQICRLLEPFKDIEPFKKIYNDNFVEELKKEFKPEKGGVGKEKIDHNKSKNTPWGKYLGISVLLLGFVFVLYNYKKILEYFQTKQTQ